MPAKAVYRTLEVTSVPIAEAGCASCRLWATLERGREKVDAWLAPVDPAGILRQLVTGTRLSQNPSDFLGLIGLAHLFWLSGIHLYAIARIWSSIAKWSIVRLDRVPIPWARNIESCVAIGLWGAAWILAGASLGMIRPWLLFAARGISRRLGLRWRWSAPIWMALAMDLAWRGWRGGLTSPGQWRSALAVCGGFLGTSIWTRAVGFWALPTAFDAFRSGTLALIAPFQSLVAIPLYGGIVYPTIAISLLLKVLGFEAWAQSLIALCGQIAYGFVGWVASLALEPGSFWIVSPWAILLGAIAAIVGCWRGSYLEVGSSRRMTLVACGLATIRLSVSAWANHGETHAFADHVEQLAFADHVEQLDVGQGDSAWVAYELPGHHLGAGLIDAGSERALSDRDWMRIFAGRSVTRLEWIALTHLDEDHAGGVKRLARLLPIGCVATSREEIESERGQQYKSQLADLGIPLLDWSSGCVAFPVLPPAPSTHAKANQNMSAVFVPLRSGGFFLSAGDADARDEPRIGRWASDLSHSLRHRVPKILKLSHHGSNTSSNPVWIRQIRPTQAWISVGVGNRYKHPSESVLKLMQKERIPVFRTDQLGALTSGASPAPGEKILVHPLRSEPKNLSRTSVN